MSEWYGYGGGGEGYHNYDRGDEVPPREPNFDDPLPPDPYATLGVPKNASLAAIKAAYRKLALKYHPDKAPGKIAEFQKVQAAFEILGDNDKRAEYDEKVRRFASREGPKGQDSGRSGGKDYSSGSRGYEDDYGRSRRSPSPRRSQRRRSPSPPPKRYEETKYSTWNPLRRAFKPYYRSCGLCGSSTCTMNHRYVTMQGWVKWAAANSNRAESQNRLETEFRAVAERTAMKAPKYGWYNCEVCGRGNCDKPHRYFSKEGFVWRTMGIYEDETDELISYAKETADFCYGPNDQMPPPSPPRHQDRRHENSGFRGYSGDDRGGSYNQGRSPHEDSRDRYSGQEPPFAHSDDRYSGYPPFEGEGQRSRPHGPGGSSNRPPYDEYESRGPRYDFRNDNGYSRDRDSSRYEQRGTSYGPSGNQDGPGRDRYADRGTSYGYSDNYESGGYSGRDRYHDEDRYGASSGRDRYDDDDNHYRSSYGRNREYRY